MKNEKKRSIGKKITALMLMVLFISIFSAASVSLWNLEVMRSLSRQSNKEIGETAAKDSELALKKLSVEQVQSIAKEKAGFINERFEQIAAYLNGIVNVAEDIYNNPEGYPDRSIPLPQKGSTKLAVQLLHSKLLDNPTKEQLSEMLKLGNIQDMLVQYNAQNNMVSAAYVSTVSGWVIQADYMAYTKYSQDGELLNLESSERPWYQQALKAERGSVVYSDIIADFHSSSDCIVCAQPIYRDDEIVAVAGIGSYLDTVNEAILETTIGDSGYAFLVNHNGKVIVSGARTGEIAVKASGAKSDNSNVYTADNEDLRNSKNDELADIASKMVALEEGIDKLILDGKEMYIAYVPLKRLGWSLAAVVDMEEVIAPARESHQVILKMTDEVTSKQGETIRSMLYFYMALIVAAALLLSITSTRIAKKITNPIVELTKEVAQIGSGNLDYRIDIITGDEVEDLGHAFNNMAMQLKQYIANLAEVMVEKERIRTELGVASRIQTDMLPGIHQAQLAERTEFVLYAKMVPAKEVGGDFYDFFLIDDDHLAFVVADVSGKGVPAALFMVISKTMLRSRILYSKSLAEAVSEVNNSLCDSNGNGMFVTAWIGLLTLSTGKLVYVNAGHNQPLLMRHGGSYEYMTERGGFVLAGFEDMEYRQQEIQLNPGDSIFLYTDGVTEANDTQKNLYGDDRLERILNENRNLEPELLVTSVWQNIKKFQGKEAQFDDITMLGLRYTGYLVKTVKPELENIPEVQCFIQDILRKRGYSSLMEKNIHVAVDEVLSNICFYSGAAEVTIGCCIIEQDEEIMATLFFEDDGKKYNPLEKEEPDITLGAEQREIGGLGIYIVTKIMDEVHYEYKNNKNRLIICKKNKNKS